MNINMQDATKQGYTFSWFQREEVPARRTWRDRFLRRHPTMYVWNRRVVVLQVDKVRVERFGGWPAILNAFLLPMIPGGASGVGPWGTQIECDGSQFESTHADRGDGGGPV